jgi:starch synthase (maltosyl-transferring)
VLEYYRGNLFANTPDILHEFLQSGGRPAFRLRLLLAGTLSPLYGIYSGYELSENVPVRVGSEEYLDSEKYELKPRDFAAPGNLDSDIATLNRIRRENRPLQRADNLSFHASENEHILFFRKAGRDRDPAPVASSALTRAPKASTPPPASEGSGAAAPRDDDLLIAVNLDPVRAQETMVYVPIGDMGIHPDEQYLVHDLLTGERYVWRGARNYVRLDPRRQPGHLLRVEGRENG